MIMQKAFSFNNNYKLAIVSRVFGNQTTVEPVYYGHLGTSKKGPGVLILLVILYEKVTFGASTKCLDFAGVHIFKCPH